MPPKADAAQAGGAEVENVLLWDRKEEGGFPETKVLKQRVRDRIDPGRHLGHSDREGKKVEAVEERQDGQGISASKERGEGEGEGVVCEDCK